MVAIQRSVKGAAVLTTAIVVDTATTMAPISAVDNVVASIVAKSSLAFRTLTAPAVGKPPKGDTCGYGPPLGVRLYQLGAWRQCLVPTHAH
jgi:hypothetical protein